MKTIIGKCLGCLEVTRGSGEKAWKQQIMGVSFQGDDPFKNETVQEIVIGDKVYSDKLKAEINKQRGNEVQVAVVETHKVFRGAVQTTVYFDELLPAPNYLKVAS